jgi:hypothetical protein
MIARSDSIAQVERSLGRSLSIGQQNVIEDFFEARREKQGLERARQIQRLVRARRTIEFDRLGRQHVRNINTGRFERFANFLLRRKRR